MEAEGKAHEYILKYVRAVKSSLDFNEVRLVRRFKVRDATATPTLEDERVHNKEELKAS